MRYNHFDMLPEKAFQPVGKRMTLEGGGFGLGNVLSTAGSLAMGGSPAGAFGGALGSQLLQGGGGGGRGGSGGGMGSNVNGIGNQNQTQITGPYAGMNPASPAYKIMQQQAAQQQQMQPQVQQPAPQVQQPLPPVQQGMGPKGLGGVGKPQLPLPQGFPSQGQGFPGAVQNFDAGLAGLMQQLRGQAMPQQSASPTQLPTSTSPSQQMDVINALNNGDLRGMGGMAGKGGGSAGGRPMPSTPLRNSMGGLGTPVNMGGMAGKGGKFGGMG